MNRATANNDHTVVSLACAGGHLAVVELLLAHGADPTHRLKVSYLKITELIYTLLLKYIKICMFDHLVYNVHYYLNEF